MRVAVIGAAGFLGRALARRLHADARVSDLVLIDRADPPLPGPKARAATGDFADPHLRALALRGADAVIHLAAVLGGAAEADPGLSRRVNLDATLDLAEALPPRTRFVFASTIAVLGHPLPDPVTDAAPPAPVMTYGAHKAMAEVALAQMARRGRLDAVSLRPAGIVARDGIDAGLRSAFLSRLFWAVARGQDIALPVAPDSRTWLASVGRVADGFAAAALMPDLGPARTITLPALWLGFDALVAALRRRFPDSPSRITYAPDPETVALFASFPRLVTDTADRLNLPRDADAGDLVANALPEETP